MDIVNENIKCNTLRGAELWAVWIGCAIWFIENVKILNLSIYIKII